MSEELYMGTVHLLFDGGIDRNPGGTATFGWVLEQNHHELQRGYGVARESGGTNNIAEFFGLGMGLRWLVDNGWRPERLEIRSDSKLVVYLLNGRWKARVPHIRRLLNRCLALLDELGCDWRIRWWPREHNERADQLARNALDEYRKVKHGS